MYKYADDVQMAKNAIECAQSLLDDPTADKDSIAASVNFILPKAREKLLGAFDHYDKRANKEGLLDTFRTLNRNIANDCMDLINELDEIVTSLENNQ